MSEVSSKVYDVIIIGGGINGVAVARDCAMRGLSTILIEKNDLASGSSGANSGMIHGGPRYLHRDREATKSSCEEIGVIQRIAPNLMFRIPFLVPVMKSDSRLYLEMMETFAKAYDQFSGLKGGKPHVHLNASEVRKVDAGFSEEIRSAVSLDEWGTDPFRLVFSTAKSAVKSGARLLMKTRVERVVTQDGQYVGVEVFRNGPGREFLRSRTLVNLTGPWAPFLDKNISSKIRMRPLKGVFLVLDRRIVNTGLVCQAIDGEHSVFLLPHLHTTIIGTTYQDFYGHPDNVTVSNDEVGYLLQAVERYFPGIRQYRVMRAFAGVRPTLHRWGVSQNSLSREHRILDHAPDGAEGAFTMIGGKLSAHRLMAEQLTNIICKKLRRREYCRTHLESLPGCTADLPWLEESQRTGIDPLTVKRVMYRHGHDAVEILENAKRDPELGQTICACEQVLAAEIEYVVREEWARSLADICRRTRFGMGPCQSCRCVQRGARFTGSLLNWSKKDTQRAAARFNASRWRGNAPVLYGEQIKQEEYARNLLLASSGGDFEH